MDVTESGIVIDDRDLHLSNTDSPTAVKKRGCLTPSTESQPDTALFPTNVTESGMDIEDRESQLENA
jgi:hypothetical protein